MRYWQELLRVAIEEINAAEPDVVVVTGYLTDDGYPDQYPEAKPAEVVVYLAPRKR
jgi:3',5'-cyclic AMP phosphodiesterase CpdA